MLTARLLNGETLGQIIWNGANGTDRNNYSARIRAVSTGNYSTSSIPAELQFETCSAGSNAPIERMRIAQDGRVVVGTLGVKTSTAPTFQITGQSQAAGTNQRAISIQNWSNNSSGTGTVEGFYSGYNIVGNLGAAYHFRAVEGTFGGTVNNQYGFIVGTDLTGATNNYGFYSNTPAGTGRWNFYANGTAANYFAGATMVGGTDNNPVYNNAVGIAIRSEGHFLSNVDTSAAYSSLRRNNNGTLLTFHNNSTTACGIISVTGQTTAYATISDYRLKENVVDLTGAIDRVNQLQVRRFNFIADPTVTVDGFIAHEAQEVVPESVTGTKDAMEDIGTLTEWDGTIIEADITEPDSLTWDETITDEDTGETIKTRTRTRTWVKTGDRPIMQGIDQAKLVPLLTAALQESLKKIEALEARLNAAGIA